MSWLVDALKGRARAPDMRVDTERLFLRPAHTDDFEQWASLRMASRAFLEPWEPVWPADDLTLRAFRARIIRANQEITEDMSYPFLIFERRNGALLGGINLANIRRRAAQSGTLGYWMGQRFASSGYMSESVLGLCRFAFQQLRLERVEAACLPDNIASIRVLEKTGFRQEGMAREYLAIAGKRRDHLLFACLERELQQFSTQDVQQYGQK